MKQQNIIDDFFDQKGSLGQIVKDYHIRDDQVVMAKAVHNSIKNKESLVIEAGTGVGKTFAYLIPALLEGGKVIISTATKNLQDQLFFNDIPKIRDALKISVDIHILKGRANYICQLRMENALVGGQFLNKEDAGYIHTIKRFSDHSGSGEISELNNIPDSSSIWPLVTSTKENCLGKNCEFYKSCFLVKARKEALASEIVIVNHHLFFADFILKDAELSEILPEANTVIFDEAHQLPNTASIFFGQSVSTNQLVYLIHDSHQMLSKFPLDAKALLNSSKKLQSYIIDLMDLLGKKNERLGKEKINNFHLFKQKFDLLLKAIDAFSLYLTKYSDQGPEFEKLLERAREIYLKLEHWIKSTDINYVHWMDIYSKSIHFNVTPINIANHFRKFQEESDSAWIFTSATLSVNGSFDHFKSLMGLDEAKTKLLLSPFDYPNNAYLYVPNHMPEVNNVLFNITLVKKALPLIMAAKGRTFILSTSLKSMREIKSLLVDEFEKKSVNYPIISQGSGSKRKLLDQFKKHGNAVLIGSLSFWEGVDVRGSALSLVIIDKLPFQSPGDPVFESKIKILSEQGINAFMTMQLPQAIIILKQGAGRLIRDELDKGVLMICDRRIVDKPYGKRIWRSLPAFKRSRDENQVIDFLKNLD
jgi:ATP-dependent DNA helicase DinG